MKTACILLLLVVGASALDMEMEGASGASGASGAAAAGGEGGDEDFDVCQWTSLSMHKPDPSLTEEGVGGGESGASGASGAAKAFLEVDEFSQVSSQRRRLLRQGALEPEKKAEPACSPPDITALKLACAKQWQNALQETVTVEPYKICLKATKKYLGACKKLPKIHERAACRTKFFEAQMASSDLTLASIDQMAMADKEADLAGKLAEARKAEIKKKVSETGADGKTTTTTTESTKADPAAAGAAASTNAAAAAAAAAQPAPATSTTTTTTESN